MIGCKDDGNFHTYYLHNYLLVSGLTVFVKFVGVAIVVVVVVVVVEVDVEILVMSLVSGSMGWGISGSGGFSIRVSGTASSPLDDDAWGAMTLLKTRRRHAHTKRIRNRSSSTIKRSLPRDRKG